MKSFPVIRKYGLLILAGILLWLACIIFRPFEPRYEGKRLSAWADDLNPSEDEFGDGKHIRAVEAIRHFGIQAVPLAVKLCREKDSSFRTKLMDWSDGWNGKHEGFRIKIKISREEDAHAKSWEIFEIVGAVGKPAIPSLVKLLGDKDRYVAGTASSDLIYIGSDAIPPLIDALTNQNAQVRYSAAASLGGIGENFRPVTEIKGTNGGVRHIMGAVQEKFKPQIQPALPALLQCLKDEDYRVRDFTARALGNIGEDATVVVPAIITALEKESNPPPFGMISALGRFGTNAQAAVPVLIKIIKSEKMPWMTVGVLRRIDPEAAQPFVEKLKSDINAIESNSIPAVRK